MKRKILPLFLMILIASSVMGVAYAHWSDTVQIEGTVHMGELIVGILDIKFVEDSDDLDKDVCDTFVDLLDPETSVHHDPPQTVYHTMLVEVGDGVDYWAYPQYVVLVKFDLKNAGTIPAHVIRVDIWDPNAEVTWQRVTDTEWEGKKDVDGDGVLDVIMNLWLLKQTGEPLLSNQLDPCMDEPCDLRLEIKQPAEECHTYTFKIEIEAIQWNKA